MTVEVPDAAQRGLAQYLMLAGAHSIIRRAVDELEVSELRELINDMIAIVRHADSESADVEERDA